MTQASRKQGSTVPITMTIREDGIPIDLSGATNIRMGFSKKITTQGGYAGDLELTLDGELNSDGTDGKLKFPLTQEQADALEPGRYFCDVAFDLGGISYSTEVVEQRIIGRVVT